MTDEITSTATFTSWDETPTPDAEAPLPRLATAVVAFAYEGDLTGTSECRYVLRYDADGSGEATGYETIEGRLADEDGTLDLRHTCRFDADGVRDEVTTTGGTGAMAGLDAAGSFAVGHGGQGWAWTLVRR